MKRITLPWPPTKTSSNGSQGDFRGKASAAKSYKQTCAKECWAQNVTMIKSVPNDDCLPVKITYHPPTNGRVDWDNISNRAKQGFDAVAEAIGIDDGRWWPVTLCRGEKVTGGKIVIEAPAPKDKTADIPHKGQITCNS